MPFNDRYQGEHSTIIFERQPADPGVTENLSALYSKNAVSNLGTQVQLFAQIQKFLPDQNNTHKPLNRGMQLTYNTVNTVGPQYQSFMVGGNILYFGTITDITIPITLVPAPTAILMAIAQPNTFDAQGLPFQVSVQVDTPAVGQIKINSLLGSAPYSFTWIAIGQA